MALIHDILNKWFKAEDAAHATGDYGVMALGVRQNTAAALAGSDGDYQPFIFDSSGRLWVALSTTQIPALGQALMAASSPVVIASDQSPVASRGTAFSASASITRPANATQYAAGEVITADTPAALSFAGVGRANGAGSWIYNARVVSANPAATVGAPKLYLFSATLTPAADNAAFAPSDAEALTCLGTILFDKASKTTNNVVYEPYNFTPMFVKCPAGGTGIFGVLTTTTAYTPASGEVLTTILDGEQAT